MLVKVLALAKSKVALAVLGVLMVSGSGGAVAVAASQGHFNAFGIQLGSARNDGPEGTETPGGDNGAHVEGLLTACDATGGTIGVTNEHGSVFTFVVTSGTKINGETHSADRESSDGDHNATSSSTPTAGAGGSDSSGDRGSNATPTNSQDASDDSEGSATQTFALSDLCALVNTDKVQVQATTSTSGSTTTYTATKITVEGQEGPASGTPKATVAPGTEQDFSGSVVSVSATGFTLSSGGVQYTVDTSNARFSGGSLATLKAGARVWVQGTLAGGTITASGVGVRGTSSGDSSYPSSAATGH